MLTSPVKNKTRISIYFTVIKDFKLQYSEFELAIADPHYVFKYANLLSIGIYYIMIGIDII